MADKVSKLPQVSRHPGEDAIPSGSLNLDIALGCGGIPRGIIVEIFGPDASGKTTLCQHIVAEAQKTGGECAWIDVEGTLEPHYAQRCGVDIHRLLVSSPKNAEQALETLEALTVSGALALVVVDSASSLVPQNELQTPLGETGSHPAVTDVLARSLRRLSLSLRQSDTTVVFTNNIPSGRGAVYHNLAKEPSRLALKLFSALRLSLTPVHDLREGKQITGSRVQVKILKNSLAPFVQTTKFDIMYNDGMIKAGEIFDLACKHMIIKRQESGYAFQSKHLGGNRKEVIQMLRRHTGLSDEIERVVRQKLLT